MPLLIKYSVSTRCRENLSLFFQLKCTACHNLYALYFVNIYEFTATVRTDNITISKRKPGISRLMHFRMPVVSIGNNTLINYEKTKESVDKNSSQDLHLRAE
jgi:hypothetical protein